MLPLKNVGAEAVVCKPFSWTQEGILGKLEMDKECFGSFSVLRTRYLVWMM